MPDTIKALPPLKNSLSIRVYEHILQASRPVPTAEMLPLVQPEDCTNRNTPMDMLHRVLCGLSRTRIDNIGRRNGGGHGCGGLWVLSMPELDRIQAAVVKDARDQPIKPTSPAWAGQPAGPRQYDVMRGPVYVPPPSMRQGGSSVRPGADDFLACPSLVNGQRQAHHTHYIAALPSGHNPDSLPL